MARARLFVDSVEVARHDSGDLLLAIAEGAIAQDSALIELGDVIVGRATGRGSVTDVTLFNSVGIAMQDVAMARLLIDAARQAGVGVDFDFGGSGR